MDNMDKPTVENKLKSAWIVQIAVTGTHQTSMSLYCSYDKADLKKTQKTTKKKSRRVSQNFCRDDCCWQKKRKSTKAFTEHAAHM